MNITQFAKLLFVKLSYVNLVAGHSERKSYAQRVKLTVARDTVARVQLCAPPSEMPSIFSSVTNNNLLCYNNDDKVTWRARPMKSR